MRYYDARIHEHQRFVLPGGLISNSRNKTINQARGLLFPVQ